MIDETVKMTVQLINDIPNEIKKIADEYLDDIKRSEFNEDEKELISKLITKSFLAGISYGVGQVKEFAK